MAKTRRTVTKVVESTPSEKELALTKQIEALSMQQAALLQQLAASRPQVPMMGTSGVQLMVGVRNVSSYTIGIPSQFVGEPDLQLHPAVRGLDTPNTVAVISFAWWQQIRKGPHVANGMIIRDDSILGSYHHAGPADRPSDLAAGWERNLVLDPHDWIQSKTEPEIRTAITAMTSEQSLRRLLAAVDQKVADNREAIPETDADREERAVQDLPSLYQLTERLAEQRLDALGPKERV